MPVMIKDVRVICTKPDRFNLTIVKIETSEPGLYGIGCATINYRYDAVKCVLEQYLKPLLLDRDVSKIEDIWQMLNVSSYWRNGPLTGNAIFGVDMALWDIKGKMAGMPLYDLFGGKVREAVPVYRYSESDDLDVVLDGVKKLMEEGARHIRVQWKNSPLHNFQKRAPAGSMHGYYIDPVQYCLDTVEMFDRVRSFTGKNIELLHDVHERIPPTEAMWLCKELEQYRLFFLEDILSPEQGEWFRRIRSQTSIPLAQGELFNNPVEWETLIKDRLIDFIRIHMSQIGGITPTRKLTAFCEQFGVRTAWHGSPDMSPVGHMANMHIGLVSSNFGIQEWPELTDALYEVFPGAPTVKSDYGYVNGKPGLGIDIDEKAAQNYPCSYNGTPWLEMRLPDGSLQRP